MSIQKFIFSVILLFVWGSNSLIAQEAFPATGGDASGNGGSATYSIGQVFYQSNTGITESSISEGVQQPFEVSIVTWLEDVEGISLECIVYPNPTRDNLMLRVKGFSNHNMSYQLYDLNGKILDGKDITGASTYISMAAYIRGTYFLKVIEDRKESITYKVIKK